MLFRGVSRSVAHHSKVEDRKGDDPQVEGRQGEGMEADEEADSDDEEVPRCPVPRLSDVGVSMVAVSQTHGLPVG